MRMVNKFNSCGPIKPYLWDYAAGTLQTASDTARIEAHLAGCDACRVEVEGFRTAAAAMAVYTSVPEAGIPPRAPDWEGVQARIVETERGRIRERTGASWLGAMRVSPAFAGAAVSLGICTTLSAVAIPWALEYKQARQTRLISEGASSAPVNPVPAVSVRGREVSAIPAIRNAPVEMVVRPVFNGAANKYGSISLPVNGTYPLAATLVNRTGRTGTARLSVVPAGTQAAYRYEREVLLRADARPQIVLLYPSVRGFSPRPELQVVLKGPFASQEAQVSYRNYYSETEKLALIGDTSYNALLPKQQVLTEYLERVRQSSAPGQLDGRVRYISTSSRPEYAPDRVAGYGAVDTVVLDQGAVRLNRDQRTALRQWVIGGGSVILLPGAGLDLLDIAPNTPFTTAKPVSRLLPSETPLRRYPLGMGIALTVGIDLTRDEFREKWELLFVWDDLRNRAAPAISVRGINKWIASQSNVSIHAPISSPFQAALPPLTSVVYLFAGYFVLVVPVTFVVLKRTRRMNWAWATGPALAALFGGAVYGFTSDLHRAKQSRRTSGLLVSAAGEKEARFVGNSELFFPRAGRYDVTVSNSETIHMGLGSQDDGVSPGIMPHSLRVVDDGKSVSVPELTVPNLAFRRLVHAQPVSWGKGITADLKLTEGGTTVVGTIHNNTGRTLSAAYILLQASPKNTGIRLVDIRQLAPGTRKVSQKINVSLPPRMAHNQLEYFSEKGDTPLLMAKTSGEDMGPAIGQYVGGPNAVDVAVALPPIRLAAGIGAKGGAK